MTISIRRLHSGHADFSRQLGDLLALEPASQGAVESAVNAIIDQVRQRGDAAVLDYTNRFDQRAAQSMEDLMVGAGQLAAALERIDPDHRRALEQAAERIREYHLHQRQDSWSYETPDGTLLGQQIRPMDRVGIYVPGGKAAYPSSVLMTAIPAKVAGVPELVMVNPAPRGEVNDLVLAAASIAGVDRVFSIGGAQAVAALAYGTAFVPRVDKIVGPGNIYVATAKRAVFGQVDIDMIAGPSEILVIGDGGTDPDWIAMDLFSQAEHDEDAQAILISPDAAYLDRVEASIQRLLPTLSRREIAAASLEKRGALIQVANLEEAVSLVNRIAPEHLELSVEDPEALLPGIRHAGAIFMGRHTSEALGDYCAGPNHVLPTLGWARAFGGVGVASFLRRISVQELSADGLRGIGPEAALLARAEQLEAHARAVDLRLARLAGPARSGAAA